MPPFFTFQSVTTAYARGNGKKLRTMAQHVPTKRRNWISESKNLDNGDKVGLQETLTITFGSYVQVHEEPTPTNLPEARTIGAITLGPTGNLQGGYKLLNLQTGKKITRRNWTHLPMPIEVIERVNQLGKEQNQPTLLTFQDRHGHSTMDPDP